MSRTNINIDDRASAGVMRRYLLATRREEVNFAPQTLAADPTSVEEPGSTIIEIVAYH